jgi:hypothetical protein
MTDISMGISSKSLGLTVDQIKKPTNWECTGKSPGNTPQAKLQASQMLIGLLANQFIAPYIDVRALLTAMVKDSPLANAGNIIKSEAEMQNVQNQPGAPAQPSQPPVVPQQPGGVNLAEPTPMPTPEGAGPMPEPTPEQSGEPMLPVGIPGASQMPPRF